MIEKDKTTMLESLESKLKNALDNMCTQTSDYIKGRFEEWEAKYVANDTKIKKHNENLKKVLSTCTEIKQDINQKMNHSKMQPDSEHVQKLNAQIQKLQAENIE
jgi:transcriptional regulatory protein LevR